MDNAVSFDSASVNPLDAAITASILKFFTQTLFALLGRLPRSLIVNEANVDIDVQLTDLFFRTSMLAISMGSYVLTQK